MKKVLFLAVLFAANSSFAGVSVTIDGQTYSCSQGGSGGGNQCECVTDGQRYSRWAYEYYKGGLLVNARDSYMTEADAASACRRAILADTRCYQ